MSLCGLLVSGLVLCWLAENDQPQAVCTAGELLEAVEDAQKRLTSVSLSYEIVAPVRNGIPAGGYLKRFIALKEPSFVYHSSAHGRNGLDWRDDPFYQVVVLGRHELYGVFPLSRAFFRSQVTEDSELPGTLPDEVFFHATGIWPTWRRKAPRFLGLPVVLRDVATDAEKYSVQSSHESIGGRWCYVIASDDGDKLWIDVMRMCLMAREQADQVTGAIARRFELGGYKEYRDGVWLPRWIRNIQFDYTAPDMKGRARRIIDSTLVLEVLQVNDVDDDVFSYSPPPGALEYVSENGEIHPVQARGGGMEHFDDVINWIVRNHSGMVRGQQLVMSSEWSSVNIFLLIGCGIAIIWEVTYGVYGRFVTVRKK